MPIGLVIYPCKINALFPVGSMIDLFLDPWSIPLDQWNILCKICNIWYPFRISNLSIAGSEIYPFGSVIRPLWDQWSIRFGSWVYPLWTNDLSLFVQWSILCGIRNLSLLDQWHITSGLVTYPLWDEQTIPCEINDLSLVRSVIYPFWIIDEHLVGWAIYPIRNSYSSLLDQWSIPRWISNLSLLDQ